MEEAGDIYDKEVNKKLKQGWKSNGEWVCPTCGQSLGPVGSSDRKDAEDMIKQHLYDEVYSAAGMFSTGGYGGRGTF